MKNFILIFILFTNIIHAANIILSEKEKEFISNNKVSCVSTSTWAPFNMNSNEDELIGLGLDYLNFVKEKSNLDIKCETLPLWEDVLNSIKNKKADITIATSISKVKEQYANFSKPYLSYPIAIATTIDKVFISNEEYLSNKKLAVGKGYSTYFILKEKYPNIEFTIVKNTNEALKLLSKGKVDAVVDILPVLSYNITKLGLASLKISGITNFNFDVRFMINNDEKLLPLISIINKSIDNISTYEKRVISDKWINVKFNNKDYTTFYQIAFVLILLLIYFIYSNKKLQKEIKLRQSIQEKLEEKVNIDSLTNVFNRHYLNSITDELISNANRYKEDLSFMMIDIDNFKNINDTYGHLAGDDTIKDVALKFKSLIRPSDIIIRYGGEEFLIILKKTSINEAKIVSEKLRKTIQKLSIKPESIKEDLNITVSIGLVSYNYKKHKTIEGAIKEADIALYQAKRSGKNNTKIFREIIS